METCSLIYIAHRFRNGGYIADWKYIWSGLFLMELPANQEQVFPVAVV